MSSVFLIAGCKEENQMADNVPGWYSTRMIYKTGDSLIGNMTYYKNGQSKMNATYHQEIGKGDNLSIKFQMEGRWRVEKGRLIDSAETILVTPKFLHKKIEKIMKSSHPLIGRKILGVDTHALLVQDEQGIQTEYIRIKR